MAAFISNHFRTLCCPKRKRTIFFFRRCLGLLGEQEFSWGCFWCFRVRVCSALLTACNSILAWVQFYDLWCFSQTFTMDTLSILWNVCLSFVCAYTHIHTLTRWLIGCFVLGLSLSACVCAQGYKRETTIGKVKRRMYKCLALTHKTKHIQSLCSYSTREWAVFHTHNLLIHLAFACSVSSGEFVCKVIKYSKNQNIFSLTWKFNGKKARRKFASCCEHEAAHNSICVGCCSFVPLSQRLLFGYFFSISNTWNLEFSC